MSQINEDVKEIYLELMGKMGEIRTELGLVVTDVDNDLDLIDEIEAIWKTHNDVEFNQQYEYTKEDTWSLLKSQLRKDLNFEIIEDEHLYCDVEYHRKLKADSKEDRS